MALDKEDFIQKVKVENLNEQVEQDSYVKTVEERAFARGWNACQREILNNIDKVLLPSIIAEENPVQAIDTRVLFPYNC